MNYLFTNAPWFVPGTKIEEYNTHDLEQRVAALEHKEATATHEEVPVARKDE
jgi:hypothetical protein